MDSSHSFNGPLGLCGKMLEIVARLTESASSLQEAIGSRKSKMVWSALMVHQELTNELEKLFQLWIRLFKGQPAAEEPGVKALRARIRADVERLRSIERVNSRLALTYLGAVRKILSKTGINLAPKKNLYDASGRFGRAGTSVLVNRIG